MVEKKWDMNIICSQQFNLGNDSKLLSKTKFHFIRLSQKKKTFILHFTKTGPEAFASLSWNSLFLY